MLRTLIKDSGVSQRQWAQNLGITEGHLSSILSGNKKPSLELAVKIERLTDKTIMAADWYPAMSAAGGVEADGSVRAAIGDTPASTAVS
ncbi:helix-turn-helix domain-containing protein [Pararhodobacter zhoushanensis]|uniref:Helix-turn-helix transcriptional regulator n=1 Tax=Pararhodobacter zhoushanensis TaxID=2479545 RepID=A0ABT3GYJ3_9RHOB|nr:helix-turn-helix transcriptional regulator [Pararhodobacter zhoushanensis]MCW1932636.1 helix-turn-helix transcriptional regulator [Pararhodobacter zhoushanensis]